MSVKRKSPQGKRHHVHAESLINIADLIGDAASGKIVNTFSPQELLLEISAIFRREGERVRKIKR